MVGAALSLVQFVQGNGTNQISLMPSAPLADGACLAGAACACCCLIGVQ